MVQPRGWTALYDAMVLAINHMKRASRSRRVLLVFTDGGDNNSRYSEAEVKNLIREANVRIFRFPSRAILPTWTSSPQRAADARTKCTSWKNCRK